MRVKKLIGGTAQAFLDFILPPCCLSCSARVTSPNALCASCWRDLKFITGHKCSSCGYPFDFSLSSGQASFRVCGSCSSRSRLFDQAVSALEYNESSKPLILAFKHGDRIDYAGLFAGFLRCAGEEMIGQADIIAPIPLHKARLRSRRYNQSALLCKELGAPSKVTLDLLIRIKNTPPQVGNYKNRNRNLSGAFALNSKYKGSVQGKNILLIDDVFTTGATAEKTAAILKKYGASSVSILTIARVVTPS